MLIEGRNAVAELLKTNKTIDKIVIEKGAEISGSGISLFGAIRDKGIRFQFVSRTVIDSTSLTGRHQGFIAYVEDFKYSEVKDMIFKAEELGQKALILILDGIEDPHNLGSIIRVAECAGCHGIIIPKNRAVSVNETVVKVSAGAVNHMLIARVTNIASEIEYLKENGFWIFGSAGGGEPMYQGDLTTNTAIVIGNEGDGVRPLILKSCDKILGIPMMGQVNSLNASVAAGVLLFEAVRQRGNK